jgi:hypothetical protein
LVDHIDGDPLNNVRENLRLATPVQNAHNARGKRTSKSSSFKGVSQYRDGVRWVAQIMLRGRNFHLGIYADEEQAARAYDTAAIHQHGEFARPNFGEA